MTQLAKNQPSQSAEAVPKNETHADLTLDGDLDPSQYIGDVVPDKKTTQKLLMWAAVQKETTRAKLAMELTKFLGCSLLATFLLMGAAAFNTNADKAFLKDIFPLVITPQVTLLGVTLGYYFGAKDEEN